MNYVDTFSINAPRRADGYIVTVYGIKTLNEGKRICQELHSTGMFKAVTLTHIVKATPRARWTWTVEYSL